MRKLQSLVAAFTLVLSFSVLGYAQGDEESHGGRTGYHNVNSAKNLMQTFETLLTVLKASGISLARL